MSTIEKSVTVDVPVRTAYDQWTQFETFPSFMEGVEEVRQVAVLALTTQGFPTTVAGLSWIDEVTGAEA